MKNEITIIELTQENIESMIYTIRGQKVMLDFDLARIYGYATRDFNNQIKNNIIRFENDFMFRLTSEEWKAILRWKKSTANELSSKRRYNPYAFTEQGIYMLMTVLKGDLAVEQSKALIRLFKKMKDFITESSGLSLNTNSYLESKFSSYDKRFGKIERKLEIVMDNFADPATFKHFLFLDGQRIEADTAHQYFYSLATQSIIIVDDYIDIKTLELLKTAKEGIEIVIATENKAKNKLTNSFIEDFSDILPPLKEVGASCSRNLMTPA